MLSNIGEPRYNWKSLVTRVVPYPVLRSTYLGGNNGVWGQSAKGRDNLPLCEANGGRGLKTTSGKASWITTGMILVNLLIKERKEQTSAWRGYRIPKRAKQEYQRTARQETLKNWEQWLWVEWFAKKPLDQYSDSMFWEVYSAKKLVTLTPFFTENGGENSSWIIPHFVLNIVLHLENHQPYHDYAQRGWSRKILQKST